MELWLPLFHKRMETLFDYVPQAVVTLDCEVEHLCQARYAQIVAAYTARCQEEGSVVRYLPSESLYLDPQAWGQLLQKHRVMTFSPFEYPPEQGRYVSRRWKSPHPQLHTTRSAFTYECV